MAGGGGGGGEGFARDVLCVLRSSVVPPAIEGEQGHT